MDSQINITQLGRLLNNLHRLSGLKFALLDGSANEVYTSNYMTGFCALIQDTEYGYQRCRACDRANLRVLGADSGMNQYRCHAGLIESAIPVIENGRVTATVLFGQVIADQEIASQWARTAELCRWHRDKGALRAAFHQLRRMSAGDIAACAEVALACVSEVRLQGLIKGSALTDFQRLTLYIDQHYMERLTLDSLSRALGIGKTKLCNLASREAGATLTRMIALKRIDVAKGMLHNTNWSVQQIAEDVGIPDGNYFAKVFRKTTGMSPVGYRSTQQPV